MHQDRSQPRHSPLRSNSNSRSPARQAQLEDNQTRMRKSQERIASILGLDRNSMTRPAGVGPMASGRFAAQNQSISQLLHSRREGSSNGHPYKRDPVDRASQERQPVHHTPSIGTDPSAGEGQFATSMVRQSLADLKNRLNTMRQEKQ